MTNNSVDRLFHERVHVHASQKERLGHVLFDPQRTLVPCRVRKSGHDEAMLMMDGWMGVPDHFVLFLENRQDRHECRVVSRRGNCIRVAFSS